MCACIEFAMILYLFIVYLGSTVEWIASYPFSFCWPSQYQNASIGVEGEEMLGVTK